jgi:Cytochrome P450
MALAVHPPVERPPGPELGRLQLLRLLRSRQLTAYLDRAVEVAPEVAHFRIGREHAYLVGTPELVRELFGPLGRVGRKGRGLEQTRVLLGDGLLTSEGDLHRQQRRLIQPAFHATRIDAYARIMRTAAAELPERAGWADGAVRDMAADMAALTLRIVGQTLFAADLSDDSTAVSAALAELLGRFQRVMVPGGALLNRLPLPSTRVPVRRLPAASTAPACRATTGPDSPPAVRASTRGSPAGGSTQSAASSSSPSPSGSGRAEVNSSEPSGRNAGADSPFSDRVSRTGSPPSSGTSQSADTYRAPLGSGRCTVATSRDPSWLNASPVRRGRATKAERSA